MTLIMWSLWLIGYFFILGVVIPIFHFFEVVFIFYFHLS